MKGLSTWLLASSIIFAVSCSKTTTKESTDSTTEVTDISKDSSTTDPTATTGGALKFESTHFDFPPMMEGDEVSHAYKFENTSDEEIRITKVQVSCGCTADLYPKEPIASGEENEILLKFSSKGKSGKGKKSATVYTTDGKETILSFNYDIEKVEK